VSEGAGSRAVSRFVERVARAYGAMTVVNDSEVEAGAGASASAAADVIVSVDAPSRVPGWAEHLLALGRRARKALVVIVSNPERAWPLRPDGADPIELARVLWEAGRVKERAYLAVPALVAALGGGEARHASVRLLVRRSARWQAFVVDVTPRTPQARRRLRTVEGA
jgi:hypothetical protein